MWSRVTALFGSSSAAERYEAFPESSRTSSSVTGLFRSASEDSLLAKARASGDGKDAYNLAVFYFGKETDSSYIKGAVWLVMSILRGCTEAETLFKKDKLLIPSESYPCSEQKKSNALSRCTFIALMLLNRPIEGLDSSGWIKSWKPENQPKFIRFNVTNPRQLLQDAIKANDADTQFLLSKTDVNQAKIFNEFFSYCFDSHFLDLQLERLLKVTYSPANAADHKESTSLLGAGSTSRRCYS